MATRSSRKRAAPGASPTVNSTHTNYDMQTDPNYNMWTQRTADPSSYVDSTDPYSADLYSALANQNLNADAVQANQLARRNVQTMIPRNTYMQNEPWNGMMDTTSHSVFPGFQSLDEDKADVEAREVDAEAREAMEAAKKTRKSIPPFVMKLRSFLDEDKNTDLIRWSTAGDSFVVLDEEEFARTLIPELFKHANYASFVRQLNMYGFHKQVGLSDNSMRNAERKNKSPSEYKNQYFRKGKPDWMWLIQKPKPVGTKGKGGRVRSEDANDEEDGLDGEISATTGNSYEDKTNTRGSRTPLLISQGAAAGTAAASSSNSALAKEELVELHREIKVVRQQNLAIANIIAKMKQDQDSLTAQAKAFQEQHSRHENSINAILTFLATVYNRSLENHQGQDIAAMFAGAMPQNFQQHGTVVDVGDLGDQDLRTLSNLAGNAKRQPLLLKAAPETVTAGNKSAAFPVRTSSTSQSTNLRRTPSNPQPASSGYILPEDGDMLSWINAANSNESSTPTSQMDFGEALSHLQNRNGKGPLSASERNGMLEMMSNGNGSNMATPQARESSNTVSTPKARTPVLDPQKMANISDDMETVDRTLKNSQQSLDNIISRLTPVSPGGTDFSGTEYVPPPEAGLDFDSFFDTDDYFANNAGLTPDFGANNFSFDDALGTGEAQLDDTNAAAGGRIESLQGSEATSPAQTLEEGDTEELKSPRKRQRKG